MAARIKISPLPAATSNSIAHWGASVPSEAEGFNRCSEESSALNGTLI